MLKRAIDQRLSRATIILPILLILMAAIFALDTITDYAVAAAVLHTTVLLIATRFLSARTVVTLAAIASTLTIISFVLTGSGAYEVGLINTSISIVVIAVTAYLGLRLKHAEQSVHDARERLLRLSRLTTLGQLTTSIAHEVSQPVAAITTNAGSCSRWLIHDPPNLAKAQAAIERIASDANRASEIIARVRRMARSETPRQTMFDFNQAVREIIALARADMKRNQVQLSLELADELPPAFADPIQVQQVVGNLLLNAIEAASAAAHRLPSLAIVTQLEMGGKLRFSIRDNGPGLSAEAIQHLFDAFWTTKQGGFGLGLTISRTIIEANGGHLWFAPVAEGSGAHFLFNIHSTEVPA